MFIVFTSYFTNIDVIKQHRERLHFSPWPCSLIFPTGRERWFGEDHISHHHYHRSPKKATQGTKSAGQEFWTINLFITTQVVSFQNANCFTAAFVFVSSFVQIPWDWDVLSGLRGDHSGPNWLELQGVRAGDCHGISIKYWTQVRPEKS